MRNCTTNTKLVFCRFRLAEMMTVNVFFFIFKCFDIGTGLKSRIGFQKHELEFLRQIPFLQYKVNLKLQSLTQLESKVSCLIHGNVISMT